MSQELINNFHTKLDEIVLWRFQELSNIELELDSLLGNKDNISHKSFLLRGAIALIYAHWEGAIRDIFLEYNTFLNNLLKKEFIPLTKNTVFILELLLHPNREDQFIQTIFCNIYNLNKLLNNNSIVLETYKINLSDNIDESKSLNHKNEKKLKPIEDFLNLNTSKLQIINNVINTKSNLGFEELRTLLHKFDIIICDDIMIQRYQINQLLKHRNDIAHGDNAFFNLQERDIENIQIILTKIINLIKIIKKKLRDRTNLITNS